MLIVDLNFVYDTVHHHIVLGRLKYCVGLFWSALEWVVSYLYWVLFLYWGLY